MNKLSAPKFAGLIQALPVYDHTVEITSSALQALLPASRSLSRGYLFGQPHSQKLLIEIISWGYPANRRGTATRILQPNNLTLLDSTMRTGGWMNWREFFSNFGTGKAVPAVGAVTASKIAYFYKVNLQGKNALILDMRIIRAAPMWQELSHLRFSGVTFTASQYAKYLDAIYTTASGINCSPDQIELFLFTLGSSFG